MAADGWSLIGHTPTITLAEPARAPDGGPPDWREVVPRSRDSFLTRLFTGLELRLRPDGSAEARLGTGTPLAGTWRSQSGHVLVTTQAGDGSTLDGLVPAGDARGEFDAVYTGRGRVGGVIAHVRQSLVPHQGPSSGQEPAQEPVQEPAQESQPGPPPEPQPGPPVPAGMDESAAVRELRTRLNRASLRGRWLGALGPVESLVVTEAEGLVERGQALGGGFLRLARGTDVAAGLAPGPGGWTLVVLVRAPETLTGFAVEDRPALRRLGADLLTAGRHAQAAPVLDLAAELYGHDPPRGAAELIDRLGLSDARIRCAFAESAYARLPGLLVTAAESRRELTLGPRAFNPWLDALRFVRSSAEALNETLVRLADLTDAHRRRPWRGRTGPPGADALHAAAEASAAATGSMCAALREIGSHLDGPEAVEASSEHADRLLARGQETLGAAARRLASAGPPDPGAEAATPHETVTLAIRDGVETLALLRAHMRRSDPASAARFVREQARQASHITAGYVETWRALLDDAWEKILSTDMALPFYERMVTLLLDLDLPEDALAVSEMSRARAFADALHAAGEADEEPSRGLIGAGPVDRTALLGLLTSHESAVVEYFLSGDLLAIWVCSRGGQVTSVTRRIDRARLAEDVAEFGRLARTPRHDAGSRTATAGVLSRLGAVLWDVIPDGLLPADPDEPVTVVPHAELFRVPFSALIDGSGSYLVERHAIRVLPALALTPDLTSDLTSGPVPGGPPTLVALVNPSPMAEGESLDWTERRFGAITSMYGEHVLHTGPAASVATLREVAGQGTVLYFGTHARAVPDLRGDPLASHLVLAPSAGHDGILHARDVPALGITADLVILAACETGAGAVTADGVIGLSRAFLTAGPTGLITTLYPVGERASLELMADFHESWLLDGREPVSALRHAQARAASSQRASAREPHLWAAFTFFGLGSRTPAGVPIRTPNTEGTP
ncbi:CHAT domain-containing protein [Planotetraspora mira]|nr:CHAT domain-containing protein [Planotetraspora mira]